MTVDDKGRICLSRSKRMYVTGSDRGSGGILALVPFRGAISVLRSDLLSQEILSCGDPLWANQVDQLFEMGHLHPSYPLFDSSLTETVKKRLDGFSSLLCTEMPSVEGLTGREFELIVRECAGATGLSVEDRIILEGSEVDLLFGTCDQDGQVEHFIVELKHYGCSRRRVGVSAVVRLFGLRQILRDSGLDSRAVLITTTGLSQPAANTATRYDIEHIPYDHLAEWLKAMQEARPILKMPLYRMRSLDMQSRLVIPKILRQFLCSQHLVCVGVGDRLELWDEGRYEAYRGDPSNWLDSYDNAQSGWTI